MTLNTQYFTLNLHNTYNLWSGTFCLVYIEIQLPDSEFSIGPLGPARPASSLDWTGMWRGARVMSMESGLTVVNGSGRAGLQNSQSALSNQNQWRGNRMTRFFHTKQLKQGQGEEALEYRSARTAPHWLKHCRDEKIYISEHDRLDWAPQALSISIDNPFWICCYIYNLPEFRRVKRRETVFFF